MIDLRWRLASMVLLAMAAIAGGAAAQSPCVAPAAPAKIDFEQLAKPKPPEKPACAERNRCSGGDVDRYNAAIAKFNASMFDFNEVESGREKQLNAYIAALNQFQSQTEAYSNCERSRLIKVLDSDH